MRHKWVLPGGYAAFDSVFYGSGHDEAYRSRRQSDPSFYYYRVGAVVEDPARQSMSHKEAAALLRDRVYGSAAADVRDCIAVNEHAQHALEDFCRSTYGAWVTYIKCLDIAQRAQVTNPGKRALAATPG